MGTPPPSARISATWRCGARVGSSAVRFWNSSVVLRNMRAVKALRRAISPTCGAACSSRRNTSTWPPRSTTTAAVLKPLALHSEMVASAMVLAIPSDKTRCVTRPCAPALPHRMMLNSRNFGADDMKPPVRRQLYLYLFGCALSIAQSTSGPTFEVASVKVSPPPSPGTPVFFGPARGGPGTPDPGQITWTNATLKGVLTIAYDVKDYQISGPGWLDTERYDILVKVPAGATKEQVYVMWQSLLAERFGLMLHHAPKE